MVPVAAMSPAPTSDLLLPNEHYITSLSTGEPVCQNHNYASDDELVEHIERMERDRIRAAVQTIAIRTGNTYMQEWDGALVEVVKLADVLSAIEVSA